MAGEEICQVLVWIKLYVVPLEYWTPTGLSYVASAIGRPLYMDSITLVGNRLDFAKVCVELNTSSTFPEKIEFALPNGESIDFGVEYTWKPRACVRCRTLGHAIKDCISPPKENKVQTSPSKPKQTKIWNVVNRRKDVVLGNESLDVMVGNKLGKGLSLEGLSRVGNGKNETSLPEANIIEDGVNLNNSFAKESRFAILSEQYVEKDFGESVSDGSKINGETSKKRMV
ncbi:uncharacterized protein LOC116129253 [Pistacia vera]|uniref:uncharacterized protein LOC116129253 n=1 Tax=Pistacia vera TaxID=55513 RepID=UPI001262C3BA|nr:uncharacterized protein LOC116129253 [Pistacia vera]